MFTVNFLLNFRLIQMWSRFIVYVKIKILKYFNLLILNVLINLNNIHIIDLKQPE